MDEREIRLLLIEDSLGDQKLAALMLAKAKGASFRVETCDHLKAGLERLAQGGIDAVLLDLFLPDSEGIETFNRAHFAAPAVPIVVMSTLDDEQTALKALEKGAQDYLIKGQVDGASLSRSLMFAVGRHKRVPASAPKPKGRIIVFVGAKGGVGVTTVALNMAAAVASAKRRVIAVELRSAFGTFAAHLAHPVVANLADLLELPAERINEGEIAPRLVEFPSGLRVLFGPQRLKEFGEIEPGKAEALLEALTAMADYVIVDLPDAISPASQVAIRGSKFGALVIDNDPLSLTCGKLVLEELRTAGASMPLLNIIVVKRSEALAGVRISDVSPQLGCDILGVVTPAADLCLRAQKAGTPFVLLDPSCTASGTVTEMAKRLLEQNQLKMTAASEPAGR